MKINLLTVGKLKESFFTEAVNEYKKRCSRFCELTIIELPEGKSDKPLIEEGKNLLKKLKGYVVIFDINGTEVTSPEFAKIFADRLVEGTSEFTLIIGSSTGLSDEVKGAGNISVSFGRVTYPHQLMRVICCEQIYRALTILNNVTYHK